MIINKTPTYNFKKLFCGCFMFVIYIRERINDNELYENKRLPRLITKLIQRFIKLFNIIILKKMYNNKLLIIPDINKKNVNDRLKNKLKKMGDNYYIVLSINVKKIINLNIINKKVINGKKVYKYLIESILEYILKTLELEKDTLKTLDLYIMQTLPLISPSIPFLCKNFF